MRSWWDCGVLIIVSLPTLVDVELGSDNDTFAPVFQTPKSAYYQRLHSPSLTMPIVHNVHNHCHLTANFSTQISRLQTGYFYNETLLRKNIYMSWLNKAEAAIWP